MDCGFKILLAALLIQLIEMWSTTILINEPSPNISSEEFVQIKGSNGFCLVRQEFGEGIPKEKR